MMFFPSQLDEDIIIFKSSPILLKLLNFLISLFILSSNILGYSTGEYSLIAIAIAIFCLGLATYQNVWTFDITKQSICNKKGFLMFSKVSRYTFGEVSSLIIEKYTRAGRSAEYTEISIQFKDGEHSVIESDKTKRLKDEIETAQRLQELLAYPS